MKKLLPILILLLAAAAFAQSDLPELGTIADIVGKTRMYIVADAEARKSILKKLGDKSGITIATKPGDAEFFLEYRTLDRDRVTMMEIPVETGQIDVYYYRDKQKVIAWSNSGGGGFRDDTPGSIMGKFLKAYNKKPK